VNETTLSWPLTIDATGNFAMSTSQTKIWNDRVAAVIGTRLGERAMRPNFGSSVTNVLFSDQYTDATDVTARVTSAFRTWLPQLKLQTVTLDGPNSEGVLSISVDYLAPNETPFSTQVTVGVVSPDGTYFGVNQ
jgi:phage baseplate assembly protein W